jgi:hypothetical protein
LCRFIWTDTQGLIGLLREVFNFAIVFTIISYRVLLRLCLLSVLMHWGPIGGLRWLVLLLGVEPQTVECVPVTFLSEHFLVLLSVEQFKLRIGDWV